MSTNTNVTTTSRGITSPAPKKVDEATKSAIALYEARLWRETKALIEKGDKAQQKADDFYIAAAQNLKTLREGKDQKTFLALVRDQIGLRKSRVYELLAIADGTKTVEQARAQANTRKIKHRMSVRSGTDNGIPIAAEPGTALTKANPADDLAVATETVKEKFSAITVTDKINTAEPEKPATATTAVPTTGKAISRLERHEIMHSKINSVATQLVKADRGVARKLYDLLWEDDRCADSLCTAIGDRLGIYVDGDGEDGLDDA